MPRELRIGLPFKGFCDSRRTFALDEAFAAEGSSNFEFDPEDSGGSFVRRMGGTILGDTVDTLLNEQTGLLPFKAGMKCRRLLGIRSAAQSDGRPVIAGLYTVEDMTANTDTGRFGTVYMRLNSVNRTLLDSFGTTHYPWSGYSPGSALPTTAPNILCWPLWYDSGEGGYTRGAHAFARRFLAPGGRKMSDLGAWLHMPNFLGVPAKHNKVMNPDSSTGSLKERLMPSGLQAMVMLPQITYPAPAGGSPPTSYWKDGDAFYITAAYRDESGAWSPISIPTTSTAASAATGRDGLVAVGSIGGANYYDKITVLLPMAPPGATARAIFRSSIISLTASTDPITVRATDVSLWQIIENNTQATIDMDWSKKLASSLVQDETIYRTDHISPPRARYDGIADQRYFHLYARPSPLAIILAPLTNSGTNFDCNRTDDDAYGTASGSIFNTTRANLVRVTATTIYLRTMDSTTAPDTVSEHSYVYTGKTLQEVVDWINATAYSGTIAGVSGKSEWGAQLAAGASGSDPAESLLPTSRQVTITGTSGNNFVTVSATDYGYVAVGERISGTGIPANSLVLSKAIVAGVYRLLLGTLAGAAAVLTASPAAATAEVWFDFGDDIILSSASAATAYGNQGTYGPNVPALLYYRRQFREVAPYQHEMWFTGSSPSEAQLGISLAPQLWVAGNRRQFPAQNGILTGMAALNNGAMVYEERGRFHFANLRDQKTGTDEDYQWVVKNNRRGALAWSSIVEGDGWCGALTQDGYEACDTDSSIILTGRLFRGGPNARGSLNYEIKASADATAIDNDGAACFAAVLAGSSLHLTVRTAADTRRRFKYDFSPGSSAEGLRELVDPQTGNLYGWSTPLFQNFTAMAEIDTSDGPAFFAAQDSNLGSAGDGRINQFDNVIYDYHATAGTISGAVLSSLSLAGTLARKKLRSARAMYARGDALATNKIRIARVGYDASTTVDFTVAHFSDNFVAEEIPIKNDLTTGARAFSAAWLETPAAAASLVTPSRWYGIVLLFDDADSPR